MSLCFNCFIIIITLDWSESIRRVILQPILAFQQQGGAQGGGGRWEFELLRLHNLWNMLIWPLFYILCIKFLGTLSIVTMILRILYEGWKNNNNNNMVNNMSGSNAQQYGISVILDKLLAPLMMTQEGSVVNKMNTVQEVQYLGVSKREY